ncbi:hypothetical protein BHO_0900012 [Borrelia hermsii YBT]|nr:hypothetical protein BHO_0900012 [Borrelia hermsii YBT]
MSCLEYFFDFVFNFLREKNPYLPDIIGGDSIEV